MTLNNKVIWITGASSGIGKSLAIELSNYPCQLILSSRRADVLKEVKQLCKQPENIAILPFDLLDYKTMQNVTEKAIKCFGKIDILVNNAGYGLTGEFDKISWEEHDTFINVLSTSAIALTRLFLPNMIDRKYGRIVNVSSVAAFAPYTNSGGMYIATKLMLLKFSEMIHNDYKSRNIYSCAVCPGFTHTEFHRDMKEFKSSIPSFMWMDSRKVVEQAYEASMSGKEIIINGWIYKILVFFMKITPKWLVKLRSN